MATEGEEAETTPALALSRRLQFWRSPAGQPAWARPALLVVAALAALSYAWGMNEAQLEPFYGAAARSMSESWHNFIFGSFDPWGTVSVDKLPGALWFQALSLRLFGFHVWAIILPQVIEGTLTVLVLHRAVRRVAGAGAGLMAALVMASSPIVILLNHGNISDSLLILLLVLAADATFRAVTTGRLRSLLWAGVLVGLAFQTKMVQAWLVLPAFYLAYLWAAPAAAALRRLGHIALSALVVIVVSLSWMTAVSAVPASQRPYVDGSCDNSLFSQVFSYNGLDRLGVFAASDAGCNRPSQYLITRSERASRTDLNTGAIGASWDRLLHGVFGHDDAWLLLPALIAGLGVLWQRRRRGRTDVQRAAVIVWGSWLVISFGFFSAGQFINSYYVAALLPAIGALVGIGAAAAWRERRESPTVRLVLAGTVALTALISVLLLPADVGLKGWIVGSTVAVAALTSGILLASVRPRHASRWATTVGPLLAAVSLLAGSAWASGIVVTENLSPFNSPYEQPALNAYVRQTVLVFEADVLALRAFVQNVPPGTAADVFETSNTAGYYILATGREFLSVGGFTGTVPAPSLAEFIRFVAEGRVHRVTVVTPPLTRTPDLLWVRSHCYRTQTRTGDLFTTVSIYNCVPRDARGE